jgi:hypothetical protein
MNGFDALENILKDYEIDISREVQQAAKEVASEAAKKLRKASPKKKKGGGKYAKGWAVKRGEGSGYVVYGMHGTYQLAHLLEHGHAKRNGGRTAAVVHIKPVEDWATEELLSRVREIIE